MKAPAFPISIKRGVVKIYRTPSKGYDSYTLSYLSEGKRQRKQIGTWRKPGRKVRLSQPKSTERSTIYFR